MFSVGLIGVWYLIGLWLNLATTLIWLMHVSLSNHQKLANLSMHYSEFPTQADFQWKQANSHGLQFKFFVKASASPTYVPSDSSPSILYCIQPW